VLLDGIEYGHRRASRRPYKSREEFLDDSIREILDVSSGFTGRSLTDAERLEVITSLGLSSLG
jgi:hypothetical protein